MALIKIVNYETLVKSNGIINVLKQTFVEDNGVMVGKPENHRHFLSPGDDLTGQDDRVTAVANAVWTPEVITAWEAYLLTQPQQ